MPDRDTETTRQYRKPETEKISGSDEVYPYRSDRPKTQQNSISNSIMKNARSLYRFLLFRTGGEEHLAEELMQEVCLQASKTRPPHPSSDEKLWNALKMTL